MIADPCPAEFSLPRTELGKHTAELFSGFTEYPRNSANSANPVVSRDASYLFSSAMAPYLMYFFVDCAMNKLFFALL